MQIETGEVGSVKTLFFQRKYVERADGRENVTFSPFAVGEERDRLLCKLFPTDTGTAHYRWNGSDVFVNAGGGEMQLRNEGQGDIAHLIKLFPSGTGGTVEYAWRDMSVTLSPPEMVQKESKASETPKGPKGKAQLIEDAAVAGVAIDQRWSSERIAKAIAEKQAVAV